MALDIEVMYSDIVPATGKYRQVRVPIQDTNTLQTDNVLFMILSAIEPAGPPLARIEIPVGSGNWYRRANEVHGFDNYSILRYGTGLASVFLLWGWDDGEFTWTNFADPLGPTPSSPTADPLWDNKTNWPPWHPTNSINFTGITLLMAEWAVANAQFMEDMH